MPYGRRKTYRRRSTVSKRSTRAAYAKRRPRKGYKKASRFRTKWLSPISQRKNIVFTYADTEFSVNLLQVNGNTAYYVFRGNSPYDPDFTGVGVQPYGYDELMSDTMFVNYMCPASSIKVYFHVGAMLGDIRRVHCLLFPFRDDNPVLTDISDARMIPYHKETTYDSAQESTKGSKIKSYCSTRKLFTEMNPRDYGFASVYNVNPSLGWFWILMFKIDDDVDDIDVYFDVKIKYYTSVSRYNPPDES